jgi:hypothetical protein
MNYHGKRFAFVKVNRKNGIAVALGEEEHRLATYARSGGKIALDAVRTVDSRTLKGISRKAPGMSLCFSPRSIYADVGEFSCISPDATAAHIRSAVDKIGLFREDCRIAFAKVQDIDKLKARYSYLAIPLYELDKTDLVDEREALVEAFCPIEACLAASVGARDPDMAVIVHEDARSIRIIGAKAGIIYYLITINSAESFDALADAVSGIREMTSMLMNTYQEKARKVYIIGKGELGISDLKRYDIEAEPFPGDSPGDADPSAAVLQGVSLCPRYDFTPERLHRTRRIAGYAKASIAISLVMMVVSLVLFALGRGNAGQALVCEKKTRAAIFQSARELKVLEDDYTSLSRNLDLTNISNIIETYKDFQAEPKLHAIVEAISRKVPDTVFITRIEVTRASSPEDSPQGRVAPSAAERPRTSGAGSFELVIQGVINSPYPRSKETFTSFITAMQEIYPVSKAAYSHKDLSSEFTLNCGMKP